MIEVEKIIDLLKKSGMTIEEIQIYYKDKEGAEKDIIITLD